MPSSARKTKRSFEQRLFLLPSHPRPVERRVRGRFIMQPLQERRQRVPLTMLICRNFFFFNATATTEIYTLSLPDALPISTNTNAPFALYAALTVMWGWVARAARR